MSRNRVLRGLMLASLVLASACNELRDKDGDQCDRCSRDSDCTGGRRCFPFTDGNSRCAQGTGDTCTKGISLLEPASTALGGSSEAVVP